MLKNSKYLTPVLVFSLVLIITGFLVKFGLSSKSSVPNPAVSETQVNGTKEENIQQASETFVGEQQEAEQPQLTDVQAIEKEPEILTHTVKSGDTLESISSSYGVKVSTIAESNGISKESIIREGQEFRFPSIDGILYKIKNGETLWDISSAYGIELGDILNANAIDAPDKLKVGQEIIIPGADRVKVVKAEKKPDTTKSISSASTKKSNSSINLASRGMSSSSSAGSNILEGIIWPAEGRVTSGFGPRGGELHKGIDIAAPVGTDIKAALDGKVIFSGQQSGFGKIIILSHGNGIETYYGHNSKNLFNVGEYVKQGQVIAKLGNTGRSTGPHVEFGIRKNGVPINPSLYLTSP